MNYNVDAISDWAYKNHSGRQGHASIHMPKPCRPTNYNAALAVRYYETQRAADMQNKLHRRPTNCNQLPCPLKNQMISRCTIVRTNELQTIDTAFQPNQTPWRQSQNHETTMRRNSAAP